MGTPELFPGESAVREEVLDAGWSATVGNGWALVYASPDDENLTLRVYPSFFEEYVAPAFLVVETLDGDRREPRWACRLGPTTKFTHLRVVPCRRDT